MTSIKLPQRSIKMARRSVTAITILVGTFLGASTRASADRLEDALRQALLSSPTLGAARADVAATSEGIVQAKAAGRPRASLTTSETEYLKQSTASSFIPDRTVRSDVVLGVPLYRSGVVKYAVKDVEQRYAAAQQTLRDTTASLFVAVVAAYSDVIRDEAIARAGERNVASLQANLRGIRGRFSIGDMTITDVALSETRLLLAQGSLEATRAQLVTSRETYVRVVGRPPMNLAEVGRMANLPSRVEDALDEAINNNGALQAARISIDAATYRIRSAQGERGLRVTAFGAGSYFNNLNSFNNRSIFSPKNEGTAAQAGITLELPLYQGGAPASRVRQARDERSSAMEQAIALQRDIVAQTRSAYASWKAAADYLLKAEDAIVANERALKGARMENAIGTRTLLDVLDIERELFNNRVTAAVVRRNVNVASFTLLALMGRADPQDLGLADVAAIRGIPPGNARMSWSDWSDRRSHDVSTSTATDTVPVQNGRFEP